MRDAALADRFELVTSPVLLDELGRVLAYPKLQAVIGDASQLVQVLAPATPSSGQGIAGVDPVASFGPVEPKVRRRHG